MKPFSKLTTIIALLVSIVTTLLSAVDPATLPPQYATWIVLALGALKALSHSLQGTGGVASQPQSEVGLSNITTNVTTR